VADSVANEWLIVWLMSGW